MRSKLLRLGSVQGAIPSAFSLHSNFPVWGRVAMAEAGHSPGVDRWKESRPVLTQLLASGNRLVAGSGTAAAHVATLHLRLKS